MSDVVEASFDFPTVVFTCLAGLCLVFWLLSFVGVVEGGDDAADGLLDDALEPLGITDVPVLVLASIVAIVGWVVSVLAQLYLLESLGGIALAAAGVGVGIVGLAAALGTTRAIGPVISRALQPTLAAGADELVGRVAEIRSRTVTTTTGYADTTWPDGRDERVNVRTSEHGELAAGSLRNGDRVLLIAWSADDDAYVVAPLPADLA